MTIEVLSATNINALIELVLELWDDCDFDEEFEHYQTIIGSETEICYLAKNQEQYIAFIHLGTRHDYVEGATELPIGYVEGVYVKPNFQKQGVAKKLMRAAEDWAKQKDYTQMASDTPITNLGSIEFHKKIGFTEAERIVCFIKDL